MTNRDHEKLITIARYDTGFEGETARIALENEGIACYLAGTSLMASRPYSNVMAVELQVLEGDAERAKTVLDRVVPYEGEDDFNASAEDDV